MYVSLAELKQYLGIPPDNTEDDALLEDILAQAQGVFEHTLTGRVFQVPTDPEVRAVDPSTHAIGRTLYLPADLWELVSVVDGAGEDVTGRVQVVPDGDPPYFALIREDGSWPEGMVRVTGRWAFCAEPPEDVKHAILRLAAYMYRKRDAPVMEAVAVGDLGLVTIRDGIPPIVLQVAERYRRVLL